MLAEEYEIIGKIKEIDFGERFLASKKECKDYFAIDRIKKENQHPILEETKNAIPKILGLNHSNITKMIDFKEDSDYYYYIYEYCNGGSLYDYLTYLQKDKKIISEEIGQYIMKQLIEAIKCLHNEGIVHRDIKPANIFLNYDSGEDILKKNIFKAKIKLAGFYISEHFEKGKFLNTIGGTLKFMAPEIFYKKAFNEKVDIWSLGVTFAVSFLCKLNFDFKNMETYKQVPSFKNLSKEANSFIKCTLQYDPEKRINAEELSKHEFLTKNVKDFSFQDK